MGDCQGYVDHCTFLIVGGGIAGVSCAEQLSNSSPSEKILLLTSTNLIKKVTNLKDVTENLQEFDVEEKEMSTLSQECPNVRVIKATVCDLDAEAHIVKTCDDQVFHYQKLCICTGGQPKVISYEHSDYVIGIRDTHSIKDFQEKLHCARRVVIVGNGGIATELVYEISGCEIIWVVKDSSIGKTFFDEGAATFFLPHLKTDTVEDGKQKFTESTIKRLKYGVYKDLKSTESNTGSTEPQCGGALGPDWSSGLQLRGSTTESSRRVTVEYNSEIVNIFSAEEFKKLEKQEENSCNLDSADVQDSWPVYAQLTTGKILGCDLIISATGVAPSTSAFTKHTKFDIADDGGLNVDSNMRTNVVDVYAAGDACTASWDPSPHWFQMRLWNQARQMGVFAAMCMEGHRKDTMDLPQPFWFELFAHVTQFFGYKVVLLGKYNAQGLGSEYEIILRCTKGHEYVKVVMCRGRMFGAVLIGETDLEETFENLILNGMDLSHYGESLLDPNVDIDDYFD